MKTTNENMISQDLLDDYAYLVKNDVKKLIIAVLYTDESLYASILKKNNKSRLEANQILEILCRAGVLAAEDFEDMSCVSSMNGDIYKKIKRLAQVVVF